MTKRWVLVVLMVLGLTTPAVALRPPVLTLTVLSNPRADLVSDGQALVGLSFPSTRGLHVTVGSRDVTRAFAGARAAASRGSSTGCASVPTSSRPPSAVRRHA